MRSVTYLLRSSSLKCSEQTFSVPSAIVDSVCFPLRGTGKQKEKGNTFSPVEDFTPFWWHPETQNSQVGRNETDQIHDEARHFWGSIVKNKTQRPH